MLVLIKLIEMSPTVAVVFALLAVASAEKPYLGFRIPKWDMTQIVGGSEAPVGSYPYIAGLEFQSQLFCAGSILNEYWIVTAAHCVDAVPSANSIIAKAGKHNIAITESSEQAVAVSKGIVHDQYGGGVGPYDIGLLKLATPLKFTQQVQPIKLAQYGSEPQGNVKLCGWGSTAQGSFPIMPDKLQHIEIPIVDRQTCHDAVERLTGSSPVHETNVCTGPLTGGISACSGDSGGPLTKDGELIGIVSWGIIPCGTKGAPSVYTKASEYNNWIAEQMAKN